MTYIVLLYTTNLFVEAMYMQQFMYFSTNNNRKHSALTLPYQESAFEVKTGTS